MLARAGLDVRAWGLERRERNPDCLNKAGVQFWWNLEFAVVFKFFGKKLVVGDIGVPRWRVRVEQEAEARVARISADCAWRTRLVFRVGVANSRR